MMMGIGLLAMLAVLLVLVGVPVLVIVAAARVGRTSAAGHRPKAVGSDGPVASSRPDDVRRCGTCGRAVQPAWNVCPSCGAALA